MLHCTHGKHYYQLVVYTILCTNTINIYMSEHQKLSGVDSRASWKIRRRIVNATLLFCAGIVLYLVFYGKDTELNQTIANGLIFLAGSTIGAYLFGATWDQKHKREVNSRRPRNFADEEHEDAWR